MAFAESARSYGRRLPQSWDLTHHSYRGIEVTVGAMAGAACAEWHLHAWDLARSLGKDYRPADPELVLAAWRGGMPQLWPEPAGADGDDPWHFLLTASSRDPGWPRVLECCALKLGVAGFGGFFTALAGRVRELYAQAGTARERGGAPE